MNTLSWLIYLASVTGSIGGFFTFIAFITGLGTFIGIGGILITRISITDAIIADDVTKLEKLSVFFRKWIFIFASLFLFSGTTSVILPERNTVLLIAASEIGEKVVASEKISSVVDPSIELLKTWIEEQTIQIKTRIVKTK